MAAVYWEEIMNLAILPLAITMLAGPQIMSAIIFVTSTRPVRTSAAFIIGVAIAATVGVFIAINVASLLDNNFSLGDSSDSGSTGHIVQYLLVGLLIALAVKNYVRRETVEPPRWLGTLQRADAKRAFSVGFLVILLMPSDVIVMLTVGVNLVQNNAGLLAALPFIVATVLVAALPLLLYLLFYRRAQRLAPKIRDWMNAHSWLVNIIVCGVFILLIL
jgi:threonine/homoserine/homoserine lactone efflux protein